MENKIRIVFISDTHGMHRQIEVPDGDVLIHAGDLCGHGTLKEVIDFNSWLLRLPHQEKIVVAGNHDLIFEGNRTLAENLLSGATYLEGTYHPLTPHRLMQGRSEGVSQAHPLKHMGHFNTQTTSQEREAESPFYLGNPDYLIDLKKQRKNKGLPLESEGVLDEIIVWGGPWQPRFRNWAFNVDRGRLGRFWRKCPEGADIVITHGPMYGVLDMTNRGAPAGCGELRERMETVKPAIHICGHIHEARGSEILINDCVETVCLNASVCDSKYNPTNKAFVVDFLV